MGIELAAAYVTIRADASAVLPDIQAARAGIEQSMAGVASSMQASMGAMEDATLAASLSVSTLDPAVSEMVETVQSNVADLASTFEISQSQIEDSMVSISTVVEDGMDSMSLSSEEARNSIDEFVTSMFAVQEAMSSIVISGDVFDQVGTSASEAVDAMNEVAGSTISGASKFGEMSGTLRGTTVGLRLVSSASRAVGVDMGGLSPVIGAAAMALGYLRIAMTALTNHPIIAALTAIAAVGVLVYRIFQRTGKSAKELKQETDELRESTDRLVENQQKAILRLAELAGQQLLTNSEQMEAQKIISDLESRYGDFGVEIDRTTGLIAAQADSFTKLAKAIEKTEIVKLERDYRAWTTTLEAAIESAAAAGPAAQQAAAAPFERKLREIKEALAKLGAGVPEVEAPGEEAERAKKKLEMEAKFRKDREKADIELIEDEEKRELSSLRRTFEEDRRLAQAAGAAMLDRTEMYLAQKTAIEIKHAEKRRLREEKRQTEERQEEFERELAWEEMLKTEPSAEMREAIKKFTESMRTPTEEIGTRLKKIVEMREKGLDLDIAKRGLKGLKRELEATFKVELPRRMGLEDLGRQIQDALLEKDDEWDKKTAENTALLVKKIDAQLKAWGLQ